MDRRRTGEWTGPIPTLILSAMILAAAALHVAAGPAVAQDRGRMITGTVVDNTGAALEGVRVSVRGLGDETMTEESGRFSLQLEAAEYVIRFSRIGFRTLERQVVVGVGATQDLQIQLGLRPVEADAIEVSVLRPDLNPISELGERELEEANLRDPGESLRLLNGSDAVGRGPIGLDPVVRGLRETEVGAYVDGPGSFPVGRPGWTPKSGTSIRPRWPRCRSSRDRTHSPGARGTCRRSASRRLISRDPTACRPASGPASTPTITQQTSPVRCPGDREASGIGRTAPTERAAATSRVTARRSRRTSPRGRAGQSSASTWEADPGSLFRAGTRVRGRSSTPDGS